MKKFEDLTQEQRTLFWRLMGTITRRQGVANTLEKYEPENKDSKNEDIEAALTIFSPSGRALLSSVVFWKNLDALKDILNVASKIPGLEKKILTEDQFKGCDNKNYTLLGCAELCARAYCEDPNEENAAKEIFEIIDEKTKVHGIRIPQKSQDQAAGSKPVISNPKSPSFLSQHKKKILVADLVCTIVGIVLLNAGNPLAGITLLAVGALLLLASTKKGQEVYGEVGKKLYNVLPECFKSKEPAKG